MFAESLIGRQLGGFLIQEVIGRGGMGIVFRATDGGGSTVALKLMAPELSRDDDLRERFIREAELNLDHPHILPTFSAGMDDGHLFMAMKLVEGMDLKASIQKNGPLRPSRIVRIFDQAASALDAAHENGIVHRDVKPQNLLLESSDEEEWVYLSDFGLVKTVASGTSLTASAHLVGTAHYMSPEQIRNRQIDGRSDVYSLGCVLYECLTGSVPFPHREEVAVLFSHVNDPVPSAAAEVPTLPETIDVILAKAMAKEPADRYLAAGDLAADLADVMSPARSRKRAWGPIDVKPLERVPDTRTVAAPAPLPRRSYPGWMVAAAVSAIAIFATTEAPKLTDRPPFATIKERNISSDTGKGSPSADPAASKTSHEAAPGKPKRNRSIRDPEPTGAKAPVARTDSPDVPTTAPKEDVIAQPRFGRYFYAQSGHEALCPVDAGCLEGHDLPETRELVISPTSSEEPHRYITATRYSPQLSIRDHVDQRENATTLLESLMIFNTSEGSFSVRLRPKPGVELLRFPLRAGSSWEGAWTSSPHAGSYRVSVLGKDQTSAVGQRLETVRVRTTMRWSGKHAGLLDITSWIDVRTRLAIEAVGSVRSNTANEDHYYKVDFQSVLERGPGYR